jgi:hypothetical protein
VRKVKYSLDKMILLRSGSADHPAASGGAVPAGRASFGSGGGIDAISSKRLGSSVAKTAEEK